MKPSSSGKRWETIAAHVVADTTPVGEGAPYGFATRVVAGWREMRRNEALRRWSFWSLRAALCSVAVCGLVIFLDSRENDSQLLVQPPSADFIALPLSSK